MRYALTIVLSLLATQSLAHDISAEHAHVGSFVAYAIPAILVIAAALALGGLIVTTARRDRKVACAKRAEKSE